MRSDKICVLPKTPSQIPNNPFQLICPISQKAWDKISYWVSVVGAFHLVTRGTVLLIINGIGTSQTTITSDREVAILGVVYSGGTFNFEFFVRIIQSLPFSQQGFLAVEITLEKQDYCVINHGVYRERRLNEPVEWKSSYLNNMKGLRFHLKSQLFHFHPYLDCSR